MRIEDCLANITTTVDPDSPWTLTASGKRVDLLDPQFEQLRIDDIIHHLCRLNRFTGAVNRDMYSVGQHLITSYAIAKVMLDAEAPINRDSVEYYDQLLAVVMHDFEEFVLNDLSSPVKSAIAPSKYKWIATNMRRKIYEKWGVDWQYHNDTVKHADLNALMIERHVLLPASTHWPKVERGKLIFRQLPVMSVAEVEDTLKVLFIDLVHRRDRARTEEKRNADSVGNTTT